jgi:hypothetical protein
MTATPEYSSIGRAEDGKPLLYQDGGGKRQYYSLRFVAVWAKSASAAKLIQTDWRSRV